MPSPTMSFVPPPLAPPESYYTHTSLPIILFFAFFFAVGFCCCCCACFQDTERQRQQQQQQQRPTTRNCINDTKTAASVVFSYTSSLTIVVMRPSFDGPAVIGSDSCSICLEEFKLGDECRVLVNCNHVYHKLCVDSWLARNNHCPLCRASVHGGSVKALDDIV